MMKVTTAHASTRPSMRLRRVLVVDDNREAADTLGAMLTFLGYDVRVAYDSEKGLDEAAWFEPDVAVWDISLPGVDGYVAAGRLRAFRDGQRIMLVALTGHGSAGRSQRGAGRRLRPAHEEAGRRQCLADRDRLRLTKCAPALSAPARPAALRGIARAALLRRVAAIGRGAVVLGAAGSRGPFPRRAGGCCAAVAVACRGSVSADRCRNRFPCSWGCSWDHTARAAIVIPARPHDREPP
jgi:CheY-like chemotaxis protein